MGKTDRYKELEAEYKRLAKRADQRLVRLEKLAEQSEFQNVEKWAYERAMKDIRKWNGEDAKRFNTKAPENTLSLKSKIADIKTFLESETSTKKGIVDVYKKRADSYNKSMGTKFSWEDFARFHQSGKAEKLDFLGYRTVAKAVAYIQKNKKDIKKQLQEGQKAILYVKDDAILNKVVRDVLKEYGKNITDILGE